MATYITVVCPQCSNQMKASSDYVGKRGRCPSCKALVEITATQDGGSIATAYPAKETALAAALEARAGSTEPAAWLSGLIGLTAALFLYVCFFAVKDTAVGQLFVARGFIPYIIVLVTCWGLAMLVLKFLAVKRQKSYADLELDLIPLEIGMQITPDNVDQFLNHIAKLPAATRGSILGRRIQQALDHFKARHNVPEVQNYLATQAEIDSSSVDSGYTLLRVFIWAVPILGFIGTVIGISGAVSGLSTTLGAGGSIMQGLGGVTSGLATAFDTTLIALVMAILLLFPTESLKKIEYGMLDRIEAFTNESLLRRLSDTGGGPNTEDLPDVVKYALESAFREHQRWLAQWQAQVGELGQVIGRDFEAAAGRIQSSLQHNDAEQVTKIHEATHMLGQLFNQMAEMTASWHRSEQQMAARFERIFEHAKGLEDMVSTTTMHRDDGRRDGLALAGLDTTGGNVDLAASASMELIEQEGADDHDRQGKRGGIFGMFRRK